MESALGGNQITSSARRSVVGVSSLRQRPELLDTLWADATDRVMVFVESTARAHSRIKQLLPDLVLILIGTDDDAAGHLLTMLKMDSATSRIPVVIWMTQREQDEVDELIAEISGAISSQSVALPLH